MTKRAGGLGTIHVLIGVPILLVLVATACISAGASYRNGVRAYDSKRYEEAVSWFHDAMVRQDTPGLAYNYAVARWKQAQSEAGRYKEALNAVRSVLRRGDLMDARRERLLFVEGDLWLAVGDEREARKALEASKGEPGDTLYLPAVHRLASLDLDKRDPDNHGLLVIHSYEPEHPDIDRDLQIW